MKDEIKKEPKIKLIAGKLNNFENAYYWDVSMIDRNFEIGDYAIVENMSDYDLVKIIGIVETNEKYSRYITNRKNVKKVIMIIDRYSIRED